MHTDAHRWTDAQTLYKTNHPTTQYGWKFFMPHFCTSHKTFFSDKICLCKQLQVLPESWSLASYLSVIVQVANLGPISYSLLRWVMKRRRRRLNQSYFIYGLFVVGLMSSILLAFFWDQYFKTFL